MSERRPQLYARVEPDVFQEAQELADKHYDGNLSVLVRIAVKRFTAFLQARDESTPAEFEKQEQAA